MRRLWLIGGLVLAVASVFAADDPLDQDNVVWTSPSKDCHGSMPIGNGETGLNVWVEPNGDLVFLCGRTDSWGEDLTLCKLGRLRIRFSPSLSAGDFRQTLRLRQGEIAIQGGTTNSPIRVRLWPDAFHQVAHIEAESDQDFQMQVALEVWRPTDTVFAGQKNRIAWCHRNAASLWKPSLAVQHLQPAIAIGQDPLLYRTFGGLIQGKGLVRVNDQTLKTAAPGKQFRVALHTQTMTPATEAEWLAAIEKRAAATDAVSIERARAAHRRWWNEFWNRSWLRASGTPEAETATRGYILQRFITAAGGRGHFPIKFNGSIFTVDGGATQNPDFREWGGCYWFQNTRLIYWPMLAAGDFELMRPWFRMYKDALPLGRIQSKVRFNHDGCFFPEVMPFYGGYGWSGPWKDNKPPELLPRTPGYGSHHYNNMLELLAMMLDYYAYTRDNNFLHQELLPIADAYLLWWDKQWSRDAAGKLIIAPANALETYWAVSNPAPDVAGLTWDLDRLLALSDKELDAPRRARWRGLRQAVPALPTMTRGNKKVVAPCETPNDRCNMENPELYVVFPYRMYGVGKPDLQLALDTFSTRISKAHYCWFQDDTQAAFLGLTTIARDCVAQRAQSKNPGSRFPAFWGPNCDWLPDQDHGGNLLMAMQTMLLQADDGKLRLLPAWPKEWDVAFKLHAPGQTIVEGVYRHGKLEHWNVTPAARAKDVRLPSDRE